MSPQQIPSVPSVTPEHAKLRTLVGEWLGEEMVYPSGSDRGGRASSHTIARPELDGFFVVADYVEEREGAVPYRGHCVYGWDPQSATYTMHWFDSMGSFPTTVARGKWTDRERAPEAVASAAPANRAQEHDGTLTFEQRTHHGYARFIYEFIGIDVYLFRIESSKDGRDYRPFMEGKYRRVG
jgi:hypothetical protein